MDKHLVKWKPVLTKNVLGKMFLNQEFPTLVASAYRGYLLSEILAMEPKNRISFEYAVNLAHHAFNQAIDQNRIGKNPGECFWYYENFVEWIASLGYSIHLTGDEFEAGLNSNSVIGY